MHRKLIFNADQLPALCDGDDVIYGTDAIIEFLIKKHPTAAALDRNLSEAQVSTAQAIKSLLNSTLYDALASQFIV